MKKISILFSVLILGFVNFSCEDFLDRPPLDSITDQEMSFSKTEMELYVNKYYNTFPGYANRSFGLGIFESDYPTDNMVSGAYNYNGQIAGTIVVPSSSSDGGWNWGDIRSVNYFLENYHRTTEDRVAVNPYIGEMYFWKAWFYYGLMKRFGDLPWYDEVLSTTSESLYDPRISRSIVADSIIVNLERAVTLLPEKSDATPGRIHQDVALLFLSRVALYEGTWEKYHNNTVFGVANADPSKYFRKAAEAAKKIIDKDVYVIENVDGDTQWGYWKLFNRKDLSANREVLLWRAFDKELGLFHNANNSLGPLDNNCGMSKYLVESYLCTDGKPISISPLYQGDDLVENVAKNRDPRLPQTMYLEGYSRIILGTDTTKFTLPDLTLESRSRNTTGYQQYKGVDPPADHMNGDITASIIFRYAEVLLNYAEAKAELGECSQDILNESVNKLRDRVNMPYLEVNVGFTDPDWEFPALSPLLNEIRRERRVELACEGYRFDDLMRWAATHLIKRPMIGAKMQQFIDKKDLFNPGLDPSNITINEEGYIAPHWNSPAKDGWQFDPEKNYLCPLPSNEITINPNLKQNPNYN